MAAKNTTSSAYLRRTANLPTSTVFTACCFYYHTAKQTNSESGIISLENSIAAGTNAYTIEINNAATNGTFVTYNFNSGTGTFATVTTPVVGRWYFCFLRAASGGNVSAGIRDLTTGTTEIITNGSSATFTPAVIFFGTNSYTGNINGRIAGVKMWDATLTDAEILNEASTLIPRRTSNINIWCPIVNTGTARVRDYSGNGRDLVESGQIDEDGPPISWGASSIKIKDDYGSVVTTEAQVSWIELQAEQSIVAEEVKIYILD